MHAYALDPPSTLPASSIPVIQDLVCVRLVQSGQHAAAIKLDRQFASIARGGEKAQKAAHDRRQMMDELMVQVETAEAEIETLQGGGKKKNKSGGAAAERLETLERLNERRKWHISRLEIILRLLDNGSLATDKVIALQDDVKYFVDSNMVSPMFSNMALFSSYGEG